MGTHYLLFSFLCCCCFTAITAQFNSCRSVRNQIGICIAVQDCRPFQHILSSNNPQRLDLVRRYHCGFSGRNPLVCCPQNDAPSSPISASATNPKPVLGGIGRNVPKPVLKPSPKPSLTRVTPTKAVSAAVSTLLPTECGHSLVDYIVGGKEAQLGEHPWLVGLEYLTYRGRFILCGGALISSRYVITAAHCIRNNANHRLDLAIIGEHNIVKDPDCEQTKTGTVCAPPVQKIAIQEAIKHPQYSSSGDRHNDIALIRLASNAKLSEYVQPVCLPQGNAALRTFAGTRQTVVGWGRTNETNWKSDTKQVVTIPVMENARCAKLYESEIKNLGDTQLCAGGQSGKDSCNGDSGGPLLLPEQDSRWTITAVVSIGPEVCGSENKPGVYTRVLPFRNWIIDNMKP